MERDGRRAGLRVSASLIVHPTASLASPSALALGRGPPRGGVARPQTMKMEASNGGAQCDQHVRSEAGVAE